MNPVNRKALCPKIQSRPPKPHFSPTPLKAKSKTPGPTPRAYARSSIARPFGYHLSKKNMIYMLVARTSRATYRNTCNFNYRRKRSGCDPTKRTKSTSRNFEISAFTCLNATILLRWHVQPSPALAEAAGAVAAPTTTVAAAGATAIRGEHRKQNQEFS